MNTKKLSPVVMMAGIMILLVIGSFLYNLLNVVTEKISENWTDNHTTIVLFAVVSLVCVLVFKIIDAMPTVGGNRQSNGAGAGSGYGDYNGMQVLPPVPQQHLLTDNLQQSVPVYSQSFFGDEVDA